MNKKEEQEVRTEFKKLKKYSIKYGRLEVLDEIEKWAVEEKKEILDHVDKMKYDNVVVISPDRAPAYFLGFFHAYKSCLKEIKRLRSSLSKTKQ